jgi:hypothetical protein
MYTLYSLRCQISTVGDNFWFGFPFYKAHASTEQLLIYVLPLYAPSLFLETCRVRGGATCKILGWWDQSQLWQDPFTFFRSYTIISRCLRHYDTLTSQLSSQVLALLLSEWNCQQIMLLATSVHPLYPPLLGSETCRVKLSTNHAIS